MIETIEQLKKERPDLVESFEKMSKEELLNQCYLEAIDAINMEKRVSLFMEECTIEMSKTTYTLNALKDMVKDRKEYDINEFCFLEITDDSSELYDSINGRALTHLQNM